jgi:hypothetical protein
MLVHLVNAHSIISEFRIRTAAFGEESHLMTKRQTKVHAMDVEELIETN